MRELFAAEDLPVPIPGVSAPVVLARKWRPKKFAQVVGQGHVVQALSHALGAKRLHHAYLLTGTRGTGKTTLARILAKALNCDDGITAEPCGVCSSCLQIDAGRFVDYIEIDAASNRGVGEIQQLLEQAQFAPTAGRFKVYVIDEVHMLSTHAFNAMLKTLEEPPPDVKFVLATTDPQKIPVTVLSRCLQFNLKNVAPDVLQAHLSWVLTQEQIAAEPQALQWLANAAQGSVRDSLSLTDQAIAYGAGQVTAAAVQQMLGLVHRESLARLLREIAANDAVQSMAALEELMVAGASADAILSDMARWFHQAAAQSAIGVAAEDDPTGTVNHLANAMSAEALQLAYQIVVLGRRDLNLAPDERTGLEMTLLRLLAFSPSAAVQHHGQPAAAAPSPPRRAAAPQSPAALSSAAPALQSRAAPPPVRAAAAAPQAAVSDVATPQASLTPEQWPTVARSLLVTGLSRQFVQQAQLLSFEDAGHQVQCHFRVPVRQLSESAVTNKVQDALAKHFGKPCRIQAEVGEAVSLTAAAEDASVAAEALSQAEQVIQADPLVQSILQDFGGKIVPGSIRATQPSNDVSNQSPQEPKS
jgi:DNA polymerase-3 subunit gamma/tau